jgi:hypothetical protein
MRKVSKVEVRVNGALGYCRCGTQAPKLIALDGIPRESAPNRKMNIPFCDECFAKSALGRRATRRDKETQWAPSKNEQ